MLNHEELKNRHPGIILREDYLPDYEALGITKYQIAKAMRITQPQLEAVLSGRRNVTANMALRLGKVFNQSPQMWLGMQNDYDLAVAQLEYPEIDTIIPIDHVSMRNRSRKKIAV